MDDKTKAGGQDRKRININQEHELQDWSKKFGVTPERLKEAVKAVGDQAYKVQQHLAGDQRKGPKPANERP